MPLHLAARAPRWASRAVIAAVGLAAGLTYLSGAALGIGTADRDHIFSPADAPWAQSLLPALETPFAVPWSPSSVAGRGSIAIAKGRRTALRDFAAIAAGFAIVAFGAWLSAAGVPLYSVLFAMLAMGASATFWWRGIYWSADALSPALALLAAWAGGRWLQSPRAIFAIVAVSAAVLALAEDASWLACLPGVALLFWSRVPDRTNRVRTLAAIAVAAASATLPLLARGSQRILPIHGSSLGAAVTSVSREFTPMGALLILIGLVVLWSVPRNRRALAALVAGLIAWFWLVPRSGLEIVSVPLSICGWAAVAVALAWLAQAVRPGAGRALVAVVGVLLIADPGLTRVRLSALGRDRSSEAAARMAYDFKVTDLPSGTAIIAESRRVDATLLLSSQHAGSLALIIPQGLEQVQSLVSRGRQIVAFANGRSHLERMGFLFERGWLGPTAIAVLTGQIPCVALEPGKWPDVSLLVANGSFILHGATPASAPGGVMLRLTDPQPVRFASIEPRSIPFEMGPVVHDAAAGIGDLERAAARAGVPQVVTLRIRETGRRDPITFTFAASPQTVVATADGPSTVTLCPGVARADLTLGRLPTASAALRMNLSPPFGTGWHSPEADPDPFRWTAAPNASLRISMAPPGPVRITVTATPAARATQHPTLGLAINDCQLPIRPMPPGQADYDWDVEQRCWRAGVNQLWLQSSPLVSPAALVGGNDTRLLGARVGAIRLARIPQ
ncbi:MAG: hypothetical protein Q7R30_00355 [Acidobacteriota bacterium]|nr:hypothetical protein [Acidobacteriota bacterium]